MTNAPASARAANDALTRRLLDLASRGQRPRCGDYETSHLWLSEDAGERQLAALMCAGCAVWTECGEVGRYQSFGVFGGRDTTIRPGRAKATSMNNRGCGIDTLRHR
jgi:hypothetical protein